MTAIFTKYHGPGTRHGSRISATCEGKKLVHPLDNAFSVSKNHEHAMRALALKLDREGIYVEADAPGGARVWVRTVVYTPTGYLGELRVHHVDTVKVMR